MFMSARGERVRTIADLAHSLNLLASAFLLLVALFVAFPLVRVRGHLRKPIVRGLGCWPRRLTTTRQLVEYAPLFWIGSGKIGRGGFERI